MTHRSHRNEFATPTGLTAGDESSRIRERAPAPRRVNREPDPELSLDQRLESKLARARALLTRLEPQDARARLLHIATLRRDEPLLDGILAELTAPNFPAKI